MKWTRFARPAAGAAALLAFTLTLAGAAKQDDVAALEREEQNLRSEISGLNAGVEGKRERVRALIERKKKKGTGFYAEPDPPGALRFTFKSKHAGKWVKGEVHAVGSATGSRQRSPATSSSPFQTPCPHSGCE